MIKVYQKITIIKGKRPENLHINQELQWLGSSLGLFNIRDKDKSCFRVFIEMVKSAKTQEPLSSDEIAFRTALSRGTVVHHINRLIDSGIVVNKGKRYMLRVDSLKELVSEVEKDIVKVLNTLKNFAEDIDNKLGLK